MTQLNETIQKLRAEFPESELSWRVGQHNEGKSLGQALPYLDARQIQDRLDSAVGPANWQTSYTEVIAGSRVLAVRCALSVKVDGEWVAKEDAAPMGSGDLAIKGVYSDALKRAAVHWGIGRYLYAFVAPWVELDGEGKLTRIPTLAEGMGVEARTKATIAAAKSPETKAPAEKQQPVAVKPAAAEGTDKTTGQHPQEQGANNVRDVLTPPTEHAVDADSMADAQAQRGADKGKEPVTAATAKEIVGDNAATIANPSALYTELLGKLQKLPPNMVKSYIEGPKGKEKLTQQERTALLAKVEERVKTLAQAS